MVTRSAENTDAHEVFKVLGTASLVGFAALIALPRFSDRFFILTDVGAVEPSITVPISTCDVTMTIAPDHKLKVRYRRIATTLL